MDFKLSVITATRNRSKYLARCIESVAQQSYPFKEHIIIDGGSTDGTVDALKALSRTHPHLRWVSEPDTGLSNALNKGIALATGDAVGVIGDDDFYEHNAFTVLVAEFLANPAVGMIAGNCHVIGNDQSINSTLKASFVTRRHLIECWRYWGNLVNLPAPSTFIRKHVIDLIGGFDEADRYAMDYRHWIKITEKFDVKTIDINVSRFRYDEGTISFSRNKQQWAETLSISKQYWGSRFSLGYYQLLLSYLWYWQARTLAERLPFSVSRTADRLIDAVVGPSL